ncbi:MAG: DNA polymerase III subunit beta [Xenococcus sp. (in: cyanobacteria)]
MKVNSSELNRGLSKIAPAIPSRPEIPILTHVVLKIGSVLELTGFNHSIGISTKVPLIDTEFPVNQLTVPYKIFADIVGKLSGELSFKLIDNQLSIHADHGDFTLGTTDSSEYPDLMEVTEGTNFELDWSKLAPDLKAIEAVTAKEITRPILTGVCFNKNELAATDSHRLLVISLDEEQKLPENSLVISAEILRAALKAFSGYQDTVSLIVADTLVKISNGDTSVLGFTVTGKYPPYQQLMPTKSTHTLAINVEELRAALSLLSPLQDSKSNSVILTHEGDRLILQNSVQDRGSITSWIDCPGSTPKLKVRFALRYFLEALRPLAGETQLLLNDGLSPMIIKCDRYSHLVMPIQLN